jgi:hypothetical protein
MPELSDAEVFGKSELSDEEVFGPTKLLPLPQQDLSQFSPEQLSALRFQQGRELGTITPVPSQGEGLFDPIAILPRVQPPQTYGGPGISPGLVGAGRVMTGALNTGLGLAESLSSPAAILSAGVGGVGPSLAKLIGAAWAGKLVHDLPEAAVEAYGAYKLNEPLEQKVEKTLTPLAMAAGAGLAARPGVSAALSEARMLRPEVLPPRGPYVAPLNRQLQGPVTDIEVVPPGQIPETVPTPIEVGLRQVPSERPAGAARFVQSPIGTTMDISQLSPKEQIEAMRGPRVYPGPRKERVRPAQAEPVVVGEQKPSPIKQIGFTLEGQPLFVSAIPTKPPVEESGGEVSYRAPAAAQGIPSARQSALPEQAAIAEKEKYAQTIPEVEGQVPGGGDVGGPGPGTRGENPQLPSVEDRERRIRGEGGGTPAQKEAPVVYKGHQEGFGTIPGFDLYNLTETISPTLVKGSTVTEASLNKEGFTVPDAARPGRQYTPAVKTSTGEVITGKGHSEVLEKTKGLKDFERGYVTKGGEFFNLAEVAKRESARRTGGELHAFGLFSPTMLKQSASDVSQVVGGAVNLYSEPLVERIGRIGGPVAKRVSEEAGQIVSHAKKYYGELTPVIDAAKKAAGAFMRGGSTWIRGLDRVTESAATSKVVGAIEGTSQVPTKAQALVEKLRAANFAIGRQAQRASPGFLASGLMQRILTPYGLDVIRRGRGPAWNAFAEGIATANGKSLAEVQRFLHKWKEELDAPGSDVTNLNKISQDFVRRYPRTVTHIRPGTVWHEILVSDPFNYIEQAAQRTAHAVAFREVYEPGTGLLEATRKVVQKELQTSRHGEEFDKLMRALQGHPVDRYIRWWNAPDSPLGAAARMAGQVVGGPIKALVLTGNALTNLGEAIVGGPAIFLGVRHVVPGMVEMARNSSFYKQLEMNGAVNRALQNLAFDPTSPARSLARIFSGAVRWTFMEQAMNELQEAQAAAGARILTNRIRTRDLLPKERENTIAVMRAMGFTQAQAMRAVNSVDAELLAQFETRAAAQLTAGNQAVAEKSTLGANRAFNELFWFHSYPQMVLNQFRSIIKNLGEDWSSGNWRQFRANAKLLGKAIGGRTLQGAIYTAVLALAYEGLHGLKERKQEALDNFGKFLMDSFFAAVGGPLYLVKKALESGGDTTVLQQTAGSLVSPLGIGSEVLDAAIGNGQYEGQNAFERVGSFIDNKTPGLRPLKLGFALFGLTQDDIQLQTAKRAFYQWRRSEMGWKKEIGTAGEEEDKQFRAQMRKAVSALENGKDWRKELGEDMERAAKSLYGKRLLKTPEGKPLSEEQITKLRNRIGSELVDRLQMRDAMVHEVARNLSELKESGLVPEPTGKMAIDIETEAKRGERVVSKLPSTLQAFLERNGVKSLSYEPEVGPGKKKDLLTKEQGLQMEDTFVEQLKTRLTSLMNPHFEALNESARKDILSRHIAAARAVAKIRERSQVEQERRQPGKRQ